MRTLPTEAWAGPKGEASALPLQAQSPAKNASWASSGEGLGGPAGAWESTGRAAKAPRSITAQTRHQPCLEDVLIISSPPDWKYASTASVQLYGGWGGGGCPNATHIFARPHKNVCNPVGSIPARPLPFAPRS